MRFSDKDLYAELYPAEIKADKNIGILFIHGLCSSFAELGTFTDKLTEHGITVFGFDLSGHGQSLGRRGLITRRSIDEDCDNALNEFRKHFSGKIFVMGHSFGIHQALKMTDEEEDIKGCIFVAPRIRSGAGLTGVKKLAFYMIGLSYKLMPFLPGIALTRSKHEKINLKTIALASSLSNVNRLAMCRKPAMVICGSNDLDTPIFQSKEFFDKLGTNNKKWLCLPNSGHSPFSGLDQELLLGGLLQFLQDN